MIKTFFKVCAWGIGGLFALIILLALIGGGSTDNSQTTSSASQEAEAAVNDNHTSYEDQLASEISSLKEHPTLIDVPATKEGIIITTAMMAARAKIYNEPPADLSENGKKLREEFRRLSVKYQVNAFPKLRNALAGALDTALWENNVDVAAIGDGHKTLRFTAGMFANNANIKVANDSIYETARLLRFNQTRYEWYRGSEYTYFDLNAISDSTFATVEGTTWVPIS